MHKILKAKASTYPRKNKVTENEIISRKRSDRFAAFEFDKQNYKQHQIQAYSSRIENTQS